MPNAAGEGVSTQSNQSEQKEIVSYRINHDIEFIPELFLLRNMQNGNKVSMFSTASRCLLALIESQGNIISQKEIMYIGWEAVGLQVTASAYYQNIASILKALNGISAYNNCSNMITTIKRSGLIIKDEVNIMPVYSYANICFIMLRHKITTYMCLLLLCE